MGLLFIGKGKKEVKSKSLDSIVTHTHPFLRLASILPSKTLPKFDNISAPCRFNNGGCSDLCFSGESMGSICMCPEGKIPLPDNATHCYSECSENLFHCGNGECIPHRWKCDGISECSNGKDEADCVKVATCEGSSYQCPKSKECVPNKWVCDGFKDCEDGSDEHQCNVIECGPSKTLCDDKLTCLLDIWRCDGYPDCPDESDELLCISSQFPSSSNETEDNRIHKDINELMDMKDDFVDIEGSSLVDRGDGTSDSNAWFIALVIIFSLLSVFLVIGFVLFRWRLCCFDSSQDLKFRFRNPCFGLDKSAGFRKGKSMRFKEMSVMNQSNNMSFNAYGNPHYDKPDSSNNNIYSELDSGDIISGGASITMEENQGGFYPEDDEDFQGVSSSYRGKGIDDDKVTLL